MVTSRAPGWLPGIRSVAVAAAGLLLVTALATCKPAGSRQTSSNNTGRPFAAKHAPSTALKSLARACTPPAACRTWYVLSDGKPPTVGVILAKDRPEVAAPRHVMRAEDYDLHQRYYKEIYAPEYEDLSDEEMRRRIAQKWGVAVEKLNDSEWHAVGTVIAEAIKDGRVEDLRGSR